MSDDLKMQMYEAQAMLIEREKELQEALEEIERLRFAHSERIKFDQLVSAAEKNFADKLMENINTINIKFEERFQEISRVNANLLRKIEEQSKEIENLKNAQDEKFVELGGDLLLSKINQIINKKNEDMTETVAREVSIQIENFGLEIEKVCLEMNQHTSALLLGGWQTELSNVMMIYNSKLNLWQECCIKLPQALAYHGAVLLKNTIYIIGGNSSKANDSLGCCYKLGENNEWIKMADMNEKRTSILKSSVVLNSEIWVIGGWNGKEILKSMEKYNPKTNSWTQMAKMNQERSNTSAAVIFGKIYVSGGWNGRKPLTTIEVYDPVSNKWEIFCEMPSELTNHFSIVEGTNLIIIGGQKVEKVATNEVWQIDIFDPEKQWKKLPNLIEKRYNHGAVNLPQGIIVIGGSIADNNRRKDIEIFDGKQWKLMEGIELPEEHACYPTIFLTNEYEKLFKRRLANHKSKYELLESNLAALSVQLETVTNESSSVLIFGGWNNTITDTIYILNSEKSKWQKCKVETPYKLQGHGSAILNGKIYVFGGDSGNEKEPFHSCHKLGEDGKWIKLADMDEKRTSIPKSVIAYGSSIWVIGGWTGDKILKSVEKYDPQTNLWTKMPDLNFQRNNLAASVIAGKLYVAGGWDGKKRLSSIEIYNPVKNKWEIFCDMPLELNCHCSAAEGTNLFIIGGMKSDQTVSDEVWKIDVLDPKKEWIKMPNLRQKRYNHGAVALINGIAVFGGSTSDSSRLDSVEIFDGTGWKDSTSLIKAHGVFSFVYLSPKIEKRLLRQLC